MNCHFKCFIDKKSCDISFQLFTIYSVLLILTFAGLFSKWRQAMHTYSMIIFFIIYSVINGINYWIWDVVKSAYKQIKDENTANSYPDAYPMNVVTYQKPTAPMKYQAWIPRFLLLRETEIYANWQYISLIFRNIWITHLTCFYVYIVSFLSFCISFKKNKKNATLQEFYFVCYLVFLEYYQLC